MRPVRPSKRIESICRPPRELAYPHENWRLEDVISCWNLMSSFSGDMSVFRGFLGLAKKNSARNIWSILTPAYLGFACLMLGKSKTSILPNGCFTNLLFYHIIQFVKHHRPKHIQEKTNTKFPMIVDSHTHPIYDGNPGIPQKKLVWDQWVGSTLPC